MKLLWNVLERHLDEADFLVELWSSYLRAPDYTLDELGAGPEKRLQAQLDGLVVAGPPIVERLLRPVLEHAEIDASLACAAALALLGVGSGDEYAYLSELLETSDEEDERWSGVVDALRLSERTGLDEWLLAQLRRPRGSPLRLAGLVRAAAGRGLDLGSDLGPLLRSSDPRTLAAAAKLARYCSDPDSLALVGPLAQVDDAQVRRTAIETGLIRGLPGAWASALYWAFTDGACEFRRRALLWVALLGDESCQRKLLALLDSNEATRDVLWALGFGGHAEAVDAAVALLDDEELGPLAAEAVVAIAGLPLDDESLWFSPAVADDSASDLPALADDLEAELDEDPEARLPRPNAAAIATWWQARRKQLADEPRLLRGYPWSPKVLVDALHTGPMRRRHALALELQIRSAGAARVQTTTWVTDQREQLSSLSLLDLTLQHDLPPRPL